MSMPFILKHTVLSLILIHLSTFSLNAETLWQSLREVKDGTQTLNGLVSPLDQEGKNFYLQNEDGLIEVLLNKDAKIGLLFREQDIKALLEQRKVVISEAGKEFDLPTDLYVKVRFKDWKNAQRALKERKLQSGIIHTDRLDDHLPNENELWFSGKISEFRKAHITPDKIVKVDGREFTVSTSGHNYSEQVVGLFDSKDIRPFVNQGSVYGKRIGDVFHASEVLLRPIPDQSLKDDPELPRYLFIGDSISGNYDSSIREAVAGKLNIHHPPTNCGNSGKGRERVNIWLGDYKTKGKQWDIISFNFGHWDSGNTKEEYQQNLEAVVQQLKKTGAKLIWVTTCPVPNGFDPAGDLNGGKAPGRTAGVMKKYLNPWAAEVISKHPEITVVDQWQLVKDHEKDIYKDWWNTKDVHFKGDPAAALGKLLADHVLERMVD